MRVIRLIAPALISAAIATPVSADVTVRLKRVEAEWGDRVTDVTEYRKGLKVRTDSSGGGIAPVSMIMDAGTGWTVMLWHAGKTAVVFDDTQNSGAVDKGVSDVAQSITRTGRSRQIAGSTCTVYDVKQSFTSAKRERGEAITLVIEGSMCLVRNAPGQDDFTALHRAQSALALDPMRDMSRQLTDLGVPFATELTFRIGGPTAEMTKAFSIQTTEILSVSTAAIPDSFFEIPADYTVTNGGPAQRR